MLVYPESVRYNSIPSKTDTRLVSIRLVVYGVFNVIDCHRARMGEAACTAPWATCMGRGGVGMWACGGVVVW